MSSYAFTYRQNHETTRRGPSPFLLPPGQHAQQSVQGEINGAMLIKVHCPGIGTRYQAGSGGIHGKTSPGKLRLFLSIKLGVSRKLEISPDAETGSTSASFPNWCKPIVVNVDGRTPTSHHICLEMGPQSGKQIKADLPLIYRRIVLTMPTNFPGTVPPSSSLFRQIIRKDPVLRKVVRSLSARNKRSALNPARNVCYARNHEKQLSHSGCINLFSFLHNPCRLTPAGVFLVPGNTTPKTDKIPLQGKSGRSRRDAYSLHILAYLMHFYASDDFFGKMKTQNFEKISEKNRNFRTHTHTHTRTHPHTHHTPYPRQGSSWGRGARV